MKVINSLFHRRAFVAIMLCILLPSLSRGQTDPQQVAEQTRELIQLLAEDGSEASYQELESFFKDTESVEVLFQGESGVHKAFKAIRNTLNVIGDTQTEISYETLLSFLDIDHQGSVFYGDAYGTLISNLLKYRDSKSEELTGVLKSELGRMLESKEAFESKHPFLLDDNVFFQKGRKSRYVAEDGDVVFEGRVRPATSEGTILKGLYLIESEASYAAIQSFLTSWPGRETSDSFEYPEMRLKQRRYDLPVIDIYEALIRDTRYLEASRANFVKHFFDNSVVHYAHHEIEDPERDFAQIKNASEDSLLRMLEVADYALSFDFLPTETVDLVYAKRAEIIDRLAGMGYSPEELDATKTPKPEVIEESMPPEKATIESSEVVTPEPAEEPVDEPSQWWPWLIGALVVVGGITLAFRRKS